MRLSENGRTCLQALFVVMRLFGFLIGGFIAVFYGVEGSIYEYPYHVAFGVVLMIVCIPPSLVMGIIKGFLGLFEHSEGKRKYHDQN